MQLTRREWPILIVNVISIAVFSAVAVRRLNFEFMLYVGVVILVASWIAWKQHAIRFGATILWGLTIWGMLHLAGGNVAVGDGVLYEVMLLPVSAKHEILRFDQVVHLLGFGVATLVGHHLLTAHLCTGADRRRVVLFLVVLIGCGFGAVNEVIEFVAVLVMPETGVGGYENTMLDLVFNLLGATLAAIWLAVQPRRSVADPDPGL